MSRPLKNQDMNLVERTQPKILIFVSHTGGGHISLAEALRDRLEDRFQVELCDPQPRLVHLHYKLVSRHALWLWDAEFRLANTPVRSRMTHDTYSVLLARNVYAALRKYQPDLVISTYPYLTSEVTFTMRLSRKHIPFAMLFADPNGVHESWLTEKNAQAVFAPTRETYQQALASGFAPERLHLTGWPVRAQFYRASQQDKAEKLAALGLDPAAFTVFLQGGGEGAARFVQTIENVLAVPDVQVILATGTNQVLYERYQNQPRLYALPFTKEIAPYMNAADVVMGKAGPNMLFETMALGKPFIATAYIPGQEQANLEFIRRYGLGWVALDAASQQQLIRELVENPACLESMRASVEAYRRWNSNAAECIVPLVEKFLPV